MNDQNVQQVVIVRQIRPQAGHRLSRELVEQFGMLVVVDVGVRPVQPSGFVSVTLKLRKPPGPSS